MLSLISLYAVRGQIVAVAVVVVVYLLFDSVFPWQQQHRLRTLPTCLHV